MVASVSRWLLVVAAASFGILGLVSFVAPGWASGNFPWTVGPFLAMTIGGWSLGTAAMAADVARDPRPARAYPMLVFLTLFGAGQLAVAAAFAARLRLDAPLTYPYLIGLGALLVAGLLVAAGSSGRLSGALAGASRVPAWARASTIFFAVFVGGLTIATSLAGPDGTVARGDFFPEPLGLFSIRAFSAFFFALAASALSLLAARTVRPYHELSRAGLYLIVPITLAAFANIGLFDFVGRPGSFVYLAAYVVVGVVLVARLAWVQRHRPIDELETAGEASLA